MLSPNRITKFFIIPLTSVLISCSGGDSGENTANRAPSAPAITSVSSTALTNIQLSWTASVDSSTAESQIRYEVHASTTESFTPSSETLLGTGQGQTSSELNSSRLTPDSTQFVRVVAKNKQGLSTASVARSVKIEGMEVTPLRAGMGVPTTFTFRGKGLGTALAVKIDNCTPIGTQPTKSTDTNTLVHQCSPTTGGNTLLNGRVSAAGTVARDFTVTATDQSPASIRLSQLPFKQQTIQIARIPVNGQSAIVFPPALLLQCSKVEMQRRTAVVTVPEFRCDSYRDSFGITFPYNCRTDMVNHEVSTDVPVAYVGDQEFTAAVSMNMPDDSVTVDQIKSDLQQVITASVKTALEQHVRSSVNQLAEGIKNCAVEAGAIAVTSSIVATYASGGSGAAAASASSSAIFWGYFSPCADTKVKDASAKLMNLSDALNSIATETKKELGDYLTSKILAQKPVVQFDSQCINWHPL